MDDQDLSTQEPAGWKYTDDKQQLGLNDPGSSAKQTNTSQTSISWSAPDTYSQGKSISWYTILAVVAVVVSALVYILTKDKITTGVIVVCAILIGVYAGKKPKTINYQMDHRGITIGARQYSFDQYKSYSVLDESSHSSLALAPLHRFLPYTYINCPSELRDKVVDLLSTELPRSAQNLDPLERLLRKIDF